jgi:hypothetical protein
VRDWRESENETERPHQKDSLPLGRQRQSSFLFFLYTLFFFFLILNKIIYLLLLF